MAQLDNSSGKKGQETEMPSSETQSQTGLKQEAGDLEEGELAYSPAFNLSSSCADSDRLSCPEFAGDARYTRLRDYADFQSKLAVIKRWRTDFTHFLRDFYLEYIDYQLGLFEQPEEEVDQLRQLGEKRGIFANSFGKWEFYHREMKKRVEKADREGIGEGIGEDFGFLVATAWIFQLERDKIQQLRRAKEKQKKESNHL